MWAVVGRQEMLQRKRQKSSPSHRRKEKAVTVNWPCFMVLLTLKEQVEGNMHHTGQLSVLLQYPRSWIIMPQASQFGKVTLYTEWFVCQMAWDWFPVVFFVFVLSPFAFWPWQHRIFLHIGAVLHWSTQNSCKYLNDLYVLNNFKWTVSFFNHDIWAGSIQLCRK